MPYSKLKLQTLRVNGCLPAAVNSPDGGIFCGWLLIGEIYSRSLLCRNEDEAWWMHVYYMCVCERHKHSDKAVIPALNSTKAGPASTASPPLRRETNKKNGQFPAQREKKTFALLLCSLFHSLFLFLLKRGKYRGGKIIMGGENGKKLEERAEAQALPSLEMLSK